MSPSPLWGGNKGGGKPPRSRPNLPSPPYRAPSPQRGEGSRRLTGCAPRNRTSNPPPSFAPSGRRWRAAPNEGRPRHSRGKSRPWHPHPQSLPTGGGKRRGHHRASRSPSPLWGGNKGGGKPPRSRPNLPSPPCRAPSPQRGEGFRRLTACAPRNRTSNPPLPSPPRGRWRAASDEGRPRHSRGKSRPWHPHPQSLPTRGREAMRHHRASRSPSPLWGGNKGGVSHNPDSAPHTRRTRGTTCASPSSSSVTAQTSASTLSGEWPSARPSAPNAHISSSSADNPSACATSPRA